MDHGNVNAGDTAFVLLSTALVMLMTPGLGLFYGGMVRRKNVIGTILQSLMAVPLIGIQWVLWGYSLAFGPDIKGFIGSLDWFGLTGVGLEPNADYAATIPHQAFMIYQAMFAVITPALITGAFAERIKFKSFLVFSVLWATFVYDILAHWVWGAGGWLKNMGALDFAGGNVVHISSGLSALAAALFIGKRKDYGQEGLQAHNVTMTLLGAGLLWFGWFGFNAGSALSANGLSTAAFVTTNTAAAAATISWLFAEWWRQGKPTALGAASGAVAGLVAITPAAGFVTPLSALAIGAIAGILCYGAIRVKAKLGYDDSLDAFGIHGIGGIWGALATGLFATKTINANGANGLFYGNPHQLYVQAVSVLACGAFAFIMSWMMFKAIDAVIGLRVGEEEEEIGLDLTQHGEAGYSL
ncbi:MAG: ammonium transporter [Elusimicrobia bacterium]|nr:ammonium transporter [Elusimicrobiota bacterium]